MPLKRALVDRARAIYEVEDVSDTWIDGEPPAALEYGPWFPCRVTVEEPIEGTGVSGLRGLAARGYHRLEAQAKLLVGTEYEDGSSLTSGDPGLGGFQAFDDGMRLQIESQASPEEVWFVDTGVQPIRKLRKVIGFSAGLRRSREPRVTTGELTVDQPDVALPPEDDKGEIGL